jgi:hypothetical protein
MTFPQALKRGSATSFMSEPFEASLEDRGKQDKIKGPTPQRQRQAFFRGPSLPQDKLKPIEPRSLRGSPSKTQGELEAPTSQGRSKRRTAGPSRGSRPTDNGAQPEIAVPREGRPPPSRLPSKLGTSRASGRRPLHNTKSKTKRGAGAACCAATREGGGPVEAFGTQTARPVEAFETQKARLKAPLLTKSQGLPPTARGGGSRRGVDLGVSGF